MGSRVFWRRSGAAAGLYASVALGILGTIVAARVLGLSQFGLFATAMAAAGFFQTLLDLTVEESLTKYGFRYVAQEDWGKLRRLFRRALQLKLAGGAAAGLALVALAPLADCDLRHGRPVGAACSPPRAAAARAGTRERRAQRRCSCAAATTCAAPTRRSTMGLRLAAIAVGAQFGVRQTVALIVVVAGRRDRRVSVARSRRVPPLPSSAGAIARRTTAARSSPSSLGSSAATGVVSLRATLAPLRPRHRRAARRALGLLRVAQAPQTGFTAASVTRSADPAHRADSRLGARARAGGDRGRTPLHAPPRRR